MSKYIIDENTLNELAKSVQNFSGIASKMTPIEINDAINLISQKEADFYAGTNTVLNFANITHIQDNFFYYYSVITEVSCPNLISVGYRAFGNLNSLSTIQLPKLQTIGNWAFSNCSNLINVLLPEAITIGASAFRGDTGLVNLTLPKARTIDIWCFQGNTSLERVELPSVTSIGSYAFYDSSNIRQLILSGNTICVLQNQIFNTHNLANGGIYVPDDLVNTYKEATNWIVVADYIKPISELEA